MLPSSRKRDAFQRKIDPFILIAKATRDAAEFAPFPFVKAAGATVVTLLESIRGMKANEDGCLLLAQDALNLLKQIATTAKEAPLESTRLQEPVENFIMILNTTLESVRVISGRSSIKRYFHQAADADAIRDHRQEINSAFTVFMTVTQIQIRQEQERAREEQRRVNEEQEKERKRATEFRLLERLPVVMARWNEDQTCLKGTRVALLDEIRAWAENHNPSVKRIYWLADVAGSGKSTIANHMANEWRSTGRLGGCFAFSRDVTERTNTKNFFFTLCSDLAKWHPELRPAICEAIEADPSITSRPLREQFQTLITHPVAQTQKTIIFVIDALDECVSHDRPGLLNVLLTELTDISHLIKFFITSRPEWDISRMLNRSSQNRGGFDLHGSQNVSDVRLYVESQLLSPDFPGRSTSWSGPTAQEAAALAQRAGGLFIWASTACRMLNDSVNPRNLLSRLLEDASLATLDELYMEALNMEMLPNDPFERANVSMILHAIVMVLEPLSIDAIDELLGIDNTQQVVRRLASVLSISDDRTHPVRTLHPTFREVLTDPQRCTNPTFLVDKKAIHRRLSEACFRSMQALRKNLCSIDDPSLLNPEIASLDNTLARVLTNSQRYACRFWAFHATELIEEHDIQNLTLQFFKSHFLHWLEALSLMRRADEGFWMLHHFVNQLKPDIEYQGDLRSWSHDALKFVKMHQPLIQMSASHIYVSALTFTPQSSIISQHYKPLQGTSPIILRNQDMTWPSGLTLIGHTDEVNSVSFSPDGTRIASGSSDRTIRLWDSISGLSLGTPLEGHVGKISSIAFSPDGTRIASGSDDQTIRRWDAVSGSPISTLSNNHTSSIRCIAVSPDGTRIASGGIGKAVCLWDTASGSPLGTPLTGHTDWIRCITFSPDGNQIASGSEDKTIRLWNVTSGSPVGAPLRGHDYYVVSIAFSPDGTRIASGSYDRTIRLWDAVTGSPIGTPLHGHTDFIRSIAFSPNGIYIASGSDDKTIRLWDAVSGAPLGTPLDGNTDYVYSIAFSPDGTRIVSGSRDKTVRVFDEVLKFPVDTSLDRHIGSVNCVIFSPDGTRIVSGSSDKTIRFWDADSCSPVGMPLKGHTAEVTCIIYSSDGTRLASGSQDKTVRIWDPVTGSLLGAPLTTSNYLGGVLSLAFSRDNRSIKASYFSGVQSNELDDAQLPLSIIAPRVHDQTTLSETEKNFDLNEDIVSDEEVEPDEVQSDEKVKLGEDGWVYQIGTSHQRRLLHIPHAIRRCVAVRGARLATGSDQGQVAIIDCSDLLV